MESNFYYAEPVKLQFGKRASERLEETVKNLGFKRGVLISDKLFVTNGTADKIMKLTPSIKAIYSDITPNPLLSEVEKAAALLKETDADYALALGGGSSMDLAKFACSYVFAKYPIREYFYKRQVFSSKRIPLIVLPTTAGTGSEVTSVSVMNDEISGVKSPLPTDNFYPYLAVIDPLLTLSVPPFVTAATGMDAMSHALEAYWNINRQPISDMYAKESLRLIFNNLTKAYRNSLDEDAREGMSLGALFAGLAFAQTRTAAVHACSYPLSMYHHMSHGEACAFTLDMFLKENAAVDNRLNDLARELGFNDANEMAAKIMEMKREFKLKCSIKELNNPDVKQLAKESVIHPLFNNNPKKFTTEELEKAFMEYYG
jgi:alcohol dehydrogenase